MGNNANTVPMHLNMIALILYAIYLAVFFVLGLGSKLGDAKYIGYGLLFAASIFAFMDPAIRTSWRQMLTIYAVAVVTLPAIVIVAVTLLHNELLPSRNGGAYAFMYVALFLLPNTATFGVAWLAARLLMRKP